MDKINIKGVFRRVSKGKLLWKSIVKRKNEWIGHIIRREGLLKLIIKGRVKGKNYRGRPRLEYIRQLIRDQECDSYVRMKKKADNREE